MLYLNLNLWGVFLVIFLAFLWSLISPFLETHFPSSSVLGLDQIIPVCQRKRRFRKQFLFTTGIMYFNTYSDWMLVWPQVQGLFLLKNAHLFHLSNTGGLWTAVQEDTS